MNCTMDTAMITHTYAYTYFPCCLSFAACFQPNKLMASIDDSGSGALLFIYTEHAAANWSLLHDTAWR